MKKILISILTIAVLLAGCTGKSGNKDAINKKINLYEQKVADLNDKIAELKKQVGADSNEVGLLVAVDTVKQRDFSSYINVVADIQAEDYAFISPQMNGQIIKIYVSEGQRVSQGTLLAKINDEVLQRNLAQLRTNLLLADSLYQKQKSLYEQNVISQVQYLQAKNQKDALEKNIDVVNTQIQQTNITAPFSGIVDRIDIQVGEIASPGKPIIQIVNLGSMYAKADVAENYLPYINIGDKAELNFPTYPDLKVTSTINQKGNIIDPSSRTFWVKIKFNNINEKIKPNMFANLTLKNFEAKNVIYVPSNILAKDITGWYVYIAKLEGNNYYAHKQYVKLGNADPNNTIITDGLSLGDLLITKGYNEVSENEKLTIN